MSKQSKINTGHALGKRQSDKLIVFFNKMYDMPRELDRFQAPGVRFSDDRALTTIADAVIVHAPQANQLLWKFNSKPLAQLWVSWSLESDVNYPLVNDPRFDLRMTYQRDAEVWIPYFRHYGIDLLTELVQPVPEKEPGCVIAAFCSSVVDKSGRLEYLYELSQHMEVHHYGKFMRNQYLDKDEGATTKLDTFKRYKFAIAFENSIAKDYVTEKFYDPLRVGAVPVYLGAPNVDEYAPGEDCYIDVRDFKDPAHLAAYLKQADADNALWQRHLQWKRVTLRAEFVEQVQTQAEQPHPFIRLAELVKQFAITSANTVPRRAIDWQEKYIDGKQYLVRGSARLGLALDEASLLIWRMSDGSATVHDIEASLVSMYPEAAQQIKQDLLQTLRLLQQAGAIELNTIA